VPLVPPPVAPQGYAKIVEAAVERGYPLRTDEPAVKPGEHVPDAELYGLDAYTALTHLLSERAEAW